MATFSRNISAEDVLALRPWLSDHPEAFRRIMDLLASIKWTPLVYQKPPDNELFIKFSNASYVWFELVGQVVRRKQYALGMSTHLFEDASEMDVADVSRIINTFNKDLNWDFRINPSNVPGTFVPKTTWTWCPNGVNSTNK